MVGGWFGAFVVTKGTYAQASILGGSFLRIMMPSFPAFLILLASLVYLWPRGTKGRWPSPPTVRTALSRRTRLGLLGAASSSSRSRRSS